MWWLALLGPVDLSTPFDRPVDPDFFPWYLTETGWGLLYTVLVGFPTTALLWRPTSFHLALHLVLVAVALVLVAIVTPDANQLLGAFVAGGLGIAVLVLTARTLRPPPGLVQRPEGWGWLAAGLVVVAALPVVPYAGEMIAAARAGVTAADSTLGIDHGPAQAAASIGMVLVGAQAVLAPGSRVPATSVAVAAVWFGAISIAYPDHFASAGALGGRLMIAGGALFALSCALAGRRRRPHVRQATTASDAAGPAVT